MKLLSNLDSLDHIVDGNIRKLPTKTSQLTNDSGFLTAHQDISGKANDSEVVHKTGNETIAGEKTFSGNRKFDVGTSTRFAYACEKRFNGLSNSPAYSQWTQEQKDAGNHRVWKISFPTGCNFWGRITIGMTGQYSNHNSSGYLEKMVNLSFNTSSCYNNVGCYTALGENVEKDFRISEAIWDSNNSRWQFWIYSDVASGNNAPSSIVLKCETNSDNYVTSFNNITISTACELVTDTTYTNVKGPGGQTRTVQWSTKPTYQDPYGYDIISDYNLDAKGIGKITEIKMNGSSKGTSGVVDLGTVITAHQDISGKQDKLVSGTNIKTINNQTILGSGNIEIETGSLKNTWYATCSTANSTQEKVATTSTEDFKLKIGSQVIILMSNNNTYGGVAKLNVDGTGAKDLVPYAGATSTRYYWRSNEVISVVYDGTSYIMIDSHTADANSYGVTRLSTDVNSTATNLAAAASAVKTTYDLAASKQDALVSGTNIKTINNQSLLGSGDITISGGGSADNITTRLNSNNQTEVIGIYTTQNNGRKIWEGTLAQYEAITTKDNDVYYYITDDSDLTMYQPLLISGTNIKTVNNQSLLGSGNIDITSGASDYSQLTNKPKINNVELSGNKSADDLGLKEIFIAQYGTTTMSQLNTENQKGKLLFAKKDGILYTLLTISSTLAWFTTVALDEDDVVVQDILILNNSGWSNRSQTMSVPTKTSDLTNDSGFITTIPNASDTTVGGMKVRLDGSTLYIRNDGGVV